jgi:hypothetical protein
MDLKKFRCRQKTGISSTHRKSETEREVWDDEIIMQIVRGHGSGDDTGDSFARIGGPYGIPGHHLKQPG